MRFLGKMLLLVVFLVTVAVVSGVIALAVVDSQSYPHLSAPANNDGSITIDGNTYHLPKP